MTRMQGCRSFIRVSAIDKNWLIPSRPRPLLRCMNRFARTRLPLKHALAATRISRPLLALLLFAAVLLSLFAVSFGCIRIYEVLIGVDLADIRKRGRLQVFTAYNANSYFIYRGQPMGYEYELLQRLVRDMGVGLEVIVAADMDNIVYMLNSGRGDLVASSLAVTLQRTREVQFTEHLMLTRQVLVQRSPGALPGKAIPFIESPIGLIGQRVHVRGGSVFYQRLRNLEQEIGGRIEYVTVAGNVTTESLIQMVHSGDIDYTVADEPTALINRAYYKDLDVSIPISFPQRIAWVVRKNSPELLRSVNVWLRRVRDDGTLAALHRKYYRDPRGFATRVESEYFSATGGKLSIYDELFKAHAPGLGWDWKLVASLAYQESRFNPKARSWAGAMGLMQLMPDTAQLLRVADAYDPAANIRGGVAYLGDLSKRWANIPDERERIKFVLASYNAGFGHVEDARILARRFGKNPDVWTGETAEFILKLQDPDYYNNYGVKHGYCRGEEPYRYVVEILDRYETYRKLIKKAPPAT